MRYTVYDNKTDFPVCVYANKYVAIKAMGVSERAFYAALNRAKHGKCKRWYFIIYRENGELNNGNQ